MKKLLVLGGDHFTIPVVEAAHQQGYYVITCDYLPDNVAHKISDEYANFSTTDKEGILAYAKEKKIDGIVTFTDSGVITTAYVQHHLGLPQIGPLESVEILQNKARFRQFLTDKGFNVPKAKGYTRYEDAIKDALFFNWPVIVKPVDSAASKGVRKLNNIDQLKEAVDYALQFSVSKQFIIEEFIDKQGCSSDSDCFSINGNFVVITYSAQRFDENAKNPYAPSAFSWPSTFSKEEEKKLSTDLQHLIELLGMKTSIYNIETRVGIDGKPYIMEVSPRGGGNRLAEMVRISTGVDMITAAVRAAVGDFVELKQSPLQGYWAEVIVHSDKTGKFEEIIIDKDFYAKHVFQEDLWVNRGDFIDAFTGGNKAIGTIVLSFGNEKEMLTALKEQNKWLRVMVS